MKLTLHHSPQATGTVAAAYISGNAGQWLQEIDRWGIDPTTLKGYVLPQHPGTHQAAGLLVTFTPGQHPKTLYQSVPYTRRSSKLYLPANAVLAPAVTDAELEQLLAWPVQVFHPAIGLVGFSKQDALPLSALVTLQMQQKPQTLPPEDGKALPPPLTSIEMEVPTAQEYFQQMQQQMEVKPINDLQEEPKPEIKENNWAKNLKRRFNRALLKTIKKLNKQKPPKPTKKPLAPTSPLPPGSATGATPSAKTKPNKKSKQAGKGPLSRWLQRLEDRLTHNMEQIESKRQSEISRLLKLFEENTDEALRYAIPIDSQYRARGIAPPTDTLRRNELHFNSGKLGGGGPVDSWDVGDHYFNLRRRYEQAAKTALQNGQYQKAAYIYAHLLGNYSNAASALKQGKRYHEAARLYKDYLRNKLAAAKCFEQGGLYNEAIPLYIDSQEHEKAADLCLLTRQFEQANQLYEESVQKTIAHGNYLEAARILDKTEQHQRASQTLLKAWKVNASQSSACLKVYLDHIAEQHNDQLADTVEALYTQHTNSQQYNELLNVLSYTTDKYNNPAMRNKAREVAFEVISLQGQQNNYSSLHLLKHFIADDVLVARDTSRFKLKQNKISPAKPTTQYINLAPDIYWYQGIAFGMQLVLLGSQGHTLYLLRRNTEGKTTLHQHTLTTVAQPQMRLITTPASTNLIYLYSSSQKDLIKLTLEESADFQQELQVTSPHWLSNGTIRVAIKDKNTVLVLVQQNNKLLFNTYNLEGNLVNSTQLELEQPLPAAHGRQALYEGMYYRKNYTYINTAAPFLCRITPKGKIETEALQSKGRLLAITNTHAALKLAIATDKGCLLYRPNTTGFNKCTGYFGQSLGYITDMAFLPGNGLLIAAGTTIAIYQIKDNNPRLIRELQAPAPVIALLPNSSRHECSALLREGRLMVTQLPQDH